LDKPFLGYLSVAHVESFGDEGLSKLFRHNPLGKVFPARKFQYDCYHNPVTQVASNNSDC